MNDVIVTVAARQILQWYGVPYQPDMHIRCIAHVVNLVVQAILHYFGEADDPETNDYHLDHKDKPIHFNPDEDEDQRALDKEHMTSMAVDGGDIMNDGSQDALTGACVWPAHPTSTIRACTTGRAFVG